MKTLRSPVTAFIGALALIAGSIHPPAQAQDKKKPDSGSSIETPVPVIAPPDPRGVKTEIGDTYTVKYLEAKFAFDRLVKGAPYSAVAVTESTQTLSDGNQITRKSEVTIYRDSEGRTRREQSMDGVKNWPAAGNPPRMIFINDPIAGHNYVLDPQARTARKTMGPGKGKPGDPTYNEKEKIIEKLDKAGQKMATKQDSNEPGGDAPRPKKIAKPLDGEPNAPRLDKRAFSNGLGGIMWDGNLREAVTNLDEALKGIAQPVYNDATRPAGEPGSVRVRFVIGASGAVESVTVEQGVSPFLEPALAAAHLLRFRPLMREGQAVRNQGTITFRFNGTRAKAPAPVGAPIGPRPVKTAAAEGPTIPRPVKPETSIGEKKSESLGKQIIEGIEAEGTRSTTTIAAGEIGNRLPIEIVDERWYSPELKTLLMSKHHDPRSGDTIYRLTNINRSEPDRSLFEIPSDYTLNDLSKPIRKPGDDR